jgi:hypothetical protein
VVDRTLAVASKESDMPKCVVCGGHVDWIEDEFRRVPDDCPRCVPRGYDPTADSPKVAGLMKDLAELASLLEDVRKGWDAEILANVQLRKESEGRLAELVRLVREMETMKADLAFEKAENARWEVVCDEMEAEVERLRGLLRFVCDFHDARTTLADSFALAMPVTQPYVLPSNFLADAEAALEGKP